VGWLSTSERTDRRALSARLLVVLVGAAVVVASALLILALTSLQRTTGVSSDLVRFRALSEAVVLGADLAGLSGDVSATESAIAVAEDGAARLLEVIGPVADAEGGDVRDDFRTSWDQVVRLTLAYAQGAGEVGEIDVAHHELSQELDELAAALTDRNVERLQSLRRTIEVGVAVVVVVAVLSVTGGLRERREMRELDALTELPNRERFHEVLKAELGTGSGYAAAAVAIIDIDRFRRVNETLGERQGDRVLRDVARRIEAALPLEATLARRGGDEFLLLLPGVGYARARAVAERVQAGLELPFVGEAGAVVVTVSIGVAIAPVHGRDAAALIRTASSGRDRAKAEGGNAVRVAETTASHDDGALQLEVELRQAIQNEEFELFYQPQVAMPSQEIVGAEALVRWRSPERGLVMPGEFIGALEQTGLIVPLGDWVVRRAAEQAAAWSRLRPGKFRVAVNVSARQLYDGDLLRTIREALADSGLSPERLEVEVTETVAIQNPERAVSLLESLQEIGVHVSLDDFGTGHSWLNQLKQLPGMSLKIDRSFIAGVVEEAQDRAIVAGLIAVAHTLDLGVVAEGVERADQLAVVEAMQCDLVQGFYFSPAVPADEFELLLTGRPPWIAGQEAA
jgi:diguanylate cyclase (GGDEF)-like protein